MRITRAISVSTLSLFIGTSALMYAQEQREEKPQEETRPTATQKDKQQDKAAPAPDRQNNNMAKPQESREQTGKMPEQSEDKAARSPREQNGSHDQMGHDQMGHNDRNSNSQPVNNQSGNHQSGNNMQARGGKSGGHIPEEKFRSNFGRQHTFVVNRPASGGQPQFQYGGYTFNIVDAWPSDWSYSDQVYVDYVDDQYFLYDLAHPGVTVAIVVVM